MLGETIKKFRKEKNIPISLICKGIIEEGNYWRLENDKIESSFSTIFKILNRLNVSFDEFTTHANLDISRKSQQHYEDELVELFKNKNLDGLKELKTTIQKEKDKNETIYINHLYSLTDLYISRISSRSYNAKSKSYIQDYLMKCENWGMYELTLLSNTLFVYDLDVSLVLYKKVYTKFSKGEKKDRVKVIPLTLNLLSLFIQEDKRLIVQNLVSLLSEIKIDERNTYDLLIKRWGINIANYYLSQNRTYLMEAFKVVDLFLFLEMESTYNLYYSWTNSYQKIIENIPK